MIDPDTLNRALSERINEVMASELPNATKSGASWKLGNLDGDKGGSTGIFRGRGGVYIAKDNATDESTNILGLLHRVWGGSWAETLTKAKKICNLTDVQSVAPKPKPKSPRLKRLSMRGTKPYEYLVERGIQEHTMAKYGLRRITREHLPPTKQLRWNDEYILFPYEDTSGDLVMYKWLGVERQGGKKEIGSTVPQYSTLWGWNLVNDNTKRICVCEGELDAMSIDQMEPDIPTLSMPSGASNLDWIENDYERLQQFEEIFILTDMDDAGEKAAQKIAKRLGLTRCRRISLPAGYKDANEFLLSKESGKPKFSELMEKAKTYDPSEMVSVDEMVQRVLDRDAEIKESLANRNFLFPKINFKLIPKDTGILTGYVGHGKTDFGTAVMLNEIRMGETVCIFACDTPVDDLIRLCVWQMVGHEPTPIEIESCIKRLQGSLYFVDGVEHSQTMDSVLNNMEYAVRRYGVTRFQIDNLSEIADIRKDDYDKQGLFVRKVDKFDKREGTNTMIIAHALMSGDSCDYKIPGRRDVEGDKGMVKPIQYGLSIFRNKVKEKPDEFDEGDNTSRRIKKLLEGSDAYLSVWKQRNGFRDEFELGLRFHREARWFAPEYEKFTSPLPVYPSEQVENQDAGTRLPQNDAYSEDPF